MYQRKKILVAVYFIEYIIIDVNASDVKVCGMMQIKDLVFFNLNMCVCRKQKKCMPPTYPF